jgi:hypothetical protein
LAKQYQKTSTRKGKHAVLESHLKKAGVIWAQIVRGYSCFWRWKGWRAWGVPDHCRTSCKQRTSMKALVF